MIEINYVVGDATRPEGTGNRIIAHVCNDYGGWGAGFVLALSKRDAMPEMAYRAWFNSHDGAGYVNSYVPTFPLTLGKVQMVPFVPEDDVFVANMIAQRGKFKPGDIPLSYLSLASCLSKLHVIANGMRPQASVHMPRIGCGLAGGEWSKVEMLVKYFLTDRGVPVTVYDLPVYGMIDAGGLVEQVKAREERRREYCTHDNDGTLCCVCAGGQGYKPKQ